MNVSTTFAHASTAGIIALDLTPPPMMTTEEGTAKILRMIGHFQISSVNVTAAAQRLAVGVMVVGHEGFEQLAFSTPLSGDDTQAWYYWTSRAPQFGATGQPVVSWDIDIRTQRLLRGGYKLVMISQNPAQTLTLDMDVALRLLWEID